MTQRRYPPATVPPDHPAAKLPRRRLAVLRPGMVVEGVITRMVRGGVLVDIQLESGEPAFVPLAEIPARAMPRVRQLLEQAAMQPVRLIQLDRASGTATASLHGLLEAPPEAAGRGRERGNGRTAAPQAQAPAPAAPAERPAPPSKPKLSAGERARRQQEEILRRLRGEG
ncbi:MAG TPA: S1 RNA-binding domain-containing protein [Chloroflexota bacterium]|jgi:predicted RNA-binding protein with RPS1 domain|nr:S1 RNA-binding domain-containing protein [Chloroflexota bacterium]